MTWWFIVLGVGTLLVVCVVIALALRIRSHMKTSAADLPDAKTPGNDKTEISI
jgi:hypothetical protein